MDADVASPPPGGPATAPGGGFAGTAAARSVPLPPDGISPRACAQQQDRALVTTLKLGHPEAFDAVVRQYRQRVYLHCVQLLQDPDEAQDVTQEVFLRVFRGIGRYRPDHAFYTWIYRITANCCIDHLRRRRRQPATLCLPGPGERGEGGDSGSAAEVPDEQYRPDETAMRREARELLQTAIARLSPLQRAVLTLRDIEGCSYEQIAQVLNCNRGTVKSRLFRARSQVRAWIGPALDRASGDTAPPTP